MRYAQLAADGVTVENVIVMPDTWTGSQWEGLPVVKSDTAGPGDSFDRATGVFTPAPEPTA